jgi:hypothetical protein
MNRVNVYESEFCNKIVARVKYNEKLDYWDGRNRGNGGLGCVLSIGSATK